MEKNRISPQLLQGKLKFRQLCVFNEVYDARSILKAAERLGLTQPAVTRTVRELESYLSCSLFERTNRGVVPTVFGDALAGRSKRMLAELRYATDELNALSSADTGHIVVGTLISASSKLLPLAITLVKQKSPEVIVTIKEGSYDILLPALVSGEIDIVTGRIPEFSMTGINFHPLYEERLSVVVGARHALSAKNTYELSELSDYQWIVPGNESPLRQQLEEAFLSQGVSAPTRLIESLSIHANLGILEQSDSLGVLPTTTARHFAGQARVKILDVNHLPKFGSVGYSLVSGRDPNPATRLFIQDLQKAAVELG